MTARADRALIAAHRERSLRSVLAVPAKQRTIEWPKPVDAMVRTGFPQMDRMTAEARADMGESRWAELQKEWSADHG